MLLLLLFFVLTFAFMGFYVFGASFTESGVAAPIKLNDTRTIPDDDAYFGNFETSFISMFVLLTTANFPDVMLPSYAESAWSPLFFISYLIIVLYIVMYLVSILIN